MKEFFFICFLFCSSFLFAQKDTLVDIKAADTVVFRNMEFEKFKRQAAFENKPYLVMFSASWCAPCHRLKNEVFTHPKIVKLLNENYLCFYLDIEDFDGMEINEKYFKVAQLPTILFFDPRGKQVDKAMGYFDGYYMFKKIRLHLPPAKRGGDWLQSSDPSVHE